MSTDLSKQENNNLSLIDKLRLKRKRPCLILDRSGSMSGVLEGGTKIGVLRDLVSNLSTVPKMYQFSSTVEPYKMGDPIVASGSTKMNLAFEYVKDQGHTKAILITDGIPDNWEDALLASEGLHIEILYIGPEPKPDFLDLLATRSGGYCTQEDLNNPKQLTERIQLLLESGEKKGTIEL